MADIRRFRLYPPHGKNFRIALVLFTKADEHENLHIHQLEYIELDQLGNAVLCMRKLRRLCKGVQSASTEKRSRNIALACLSAEGISPLNTKKSRTLQAAPTDASLPYTGMQMLLSSQSLPQAAAPAQPDGVLI